MVVSIDKDHTQKKQNMFQNKVIQKIDAYLFVSEARQIVENDETITKSRFYFRRSKTRLKKIACDTQYYQR